MKQKVKEVIYIFVSNQKWGSVNIQDHLIHATQVIKQWPLAVLSYIYYNVPSMQLHAHL